MFRFVQIACQISAVTWRWVLLLMIFSLPLMFNTGFDTVFETIKVIYFRLLLAVAVGGFVLEILLQKIINWRGWVQIKAISSEYKKVVQDGEIGLRRRQILVVGGLFLVIISLEFIFSALPEYSIFGADGRWQGLVAYGSYAMLLFLLLHFGVRFWRYFFLLLLFSGVLVAIFTLVFKYHLGGAILPDFADASFLGRVYGTLGQPNYLAYFLLFVLPLAVYAVQQAWERWWCARTKLKLLLSLGFQIIIFSLLLYVFILSGSRGAELALIMAVAVVVYARWGVQWWRKLLLVLGLVFLGLWATVWVRGVAIQGRSIESRVLILQAAAAAVKESPWFGTGADSFSLVYPHYFNAMIFNYEKFTDIADRVHNDFVEMFINFGLVGGVPYVILWLLLLRLAYLRARSGGLDLVIFVTILTLSIAALFNFFLTIHWVLWIFLLAYVLRLDTASSTTTQHKYPVILLLCFLLVAGLLGLFTMRWAQAEVLRGADEPAVAISIYPYEISYYYDLWDQNRVNEARLWQSYREAQYLTASRDWTMFLWRAVSKYQYSAIYREDIAADFRAASRLAPHTPIVYYYWYQWLIKVGRAVEAELMRQKIIKLLPADCRQRGATKKWCQTIYRDNPWLWSLVSSIH